MLRLLLKESNVLHTAFLKSNAVGYLIITLLFCCSVNDLKYITFRKLWETAGRSWHNWIYLHLWTQFGWLCRLYYRSVMEYQLVGQIEGKGKFPGNV